MLFVPSTLTRRMKSFLAGNTWVDAAQWITASIPSMQASMEF